MIFSRLSISVKPLSLAGLDAMPSACLAVFTQPLDYAEHSIIEGLGKNSLLGPPKPTACDNA